MKKIVVTVSFAALVILVGGLGADIRVLNTRVASLESLVGTDQISLNILEHKDRSDVTSVREFKTYENSVVPELKAYDKSHDIRFKGGN